MASDTLCEVQSVHATIEAAPSCVGSNRLFQVRDLHWCSLESGDLWCKSRQCKKTIWIASDTLCDVQSEHATITAAPS